MSPVWRHAIESTGATLLFVDDPLERWRLVAEKVQDVGWMSATNFLDPPVGSEPFGVSAYRTIAYELAEDPACETTDTAIVPTARGDLLWGIYQGFTELLAEGFVSGIPRLVAVEPFPRLQKVLDGEDHRCHFAGSTALSSIAGASATYQSFLACERTGGIAVAVDFEGVSRDVRQLAATGVYLEPSAAASLTALRILKSRGWGPLDRTVLIGTSHGYKGRCLINPPPVP
jgi:threonine synthase